MPTNNEIRVPEDVWVALASLHRHRPAVPDFAIAWYEEVCAAGTAGDAILGLRGLGREIWADEDADIYVLRQRAGWQ